MDRDAKIREYEARLNELHARGMRSQLRRVFTRYTAELCQPDPAFDELYLDGLASTGTPPAPLRRRDRFRLLVQQLDRVLELEGRVAECGCARGLSSYLLCASLRRRDAGFDGTGFEIYDSFAGLSEPGPEDHPAGADPLVARSTKAGHFAIPLATVQRALAVFPGIEYGAGWIPQAFHVEPRPYRFVHVDVDLYQPTRDSLAHFWPQLVDGGVMVCDDYNWPGARRACEEFAAEVGAVFEVTPSTQAVFLKR